MKKTVAASTIITALLAGGSYGGYKLVKDNEASVFENSVHHVVRVVDGDTIDIEAGKRLRLLGVDAPQQGTCYYDEAKTALKKLFENKDIRIEKDSTGVDRYDRYLRYVYLPSETPEVDDLFVEQWLLEKGYARVLAIAPDTRYRDLLAHAEARARSSRIGLWNSTCPYFNDYKNAATLREAASIPENPSCIIKGNISEKGYGKEYFVEGCPNYNRVKVDIKKGEQWFCTEDKAQAAGFMRSSSCDTTFK
ncbi:MAG TPA: thermonuclease family protein [Candidatus Paceibacterota bacterium]|nr:thermonuclease family protein [Candidatus Paceibacterota bacterium]